jgi:iron-sulfur cluster assembly accessory protein
MNAKQVHPTKPPQTQSGPIVGTMTMGEIVERFPQAIPVIQSAGLHCVGCGISFVETLEQGCLAHGMSEGEMTKLLTDANEAVAKNPSATPNPVKVSPTAAKKLKDLLLADGKASWGYRILVNKPEGEGKLPSYEMDFEENGNGEKDSSFTESGIKLFVANESMDLVQGASIDYLESGPTPGFSIKNPGALSKAHHDHSASRACEC